MVFSLLLSKDGVELSLDSIIKSMTSQTFNSIAKIPNENEIYISVTDEGNLYLINQQSQEEKQKLIINELNELDSMMIDDDKNLDTRINSNHSTKKKSNKFSNKFNPY